MGLLSKNRYEHIHVRFSQAIPGLRNFWKAIPYPHFRSAGHSLCGKSARRICSDPEVTNWRFRIKMMLHLGLEQFGGGDGVYQGVVAGVVW